MIPLRTTEAILASYWNTLFSELDAKLTALLGGRTFLVTHGDLSLAGKTFWFNQGLAEAPRSQGLGGKACYDHSPFTDAAADEDLEVALFDAAKKIVVFTEPIPAEYRELLGLGLGLNVSFFNESLEAHQRLYQPEPENPEDDPPPAELYWLMEPTFYRAERKCSYGLAEIICEGVGTLPIPWAWNKYRFFRVHNLSDQPLRVEFEGPPGNAGVIPITLAAHGIRCVRRAASGLTDGFNYFPKYKTGDLTVYQMPLDAKTPWGSAGANTVLHPALVYQWIAMLERYTDPETGERSTGVRRDPHQLDDVEALYRSVFGPGI